MEGIDSSELSRRKAAGECLRCAWPSSRKGAHRVKDCRRPTKLDKGTAIIAGVRRQQKSAKPLEIKVLEDSTDSEVSVTTENHSSSG